MKEFTEIGPKTYAYSQQEYDNKISIKKKAKGTNRNVITKTINFDHFKKCLFNNHMLSTKM